MLNKKHFGFIHFLEDIKLTFFTAEQNTYVYIYHNFLIINLLILNLFNETGSHVAPNYSWTHRFAKADLDPLPFRHYRCGPPDPAAIHLLLGISAASVILALTHSAAIAKPFLGALP